MYGSPRLQMLHRHHQKILSLTSPQCECADQIPAKQRPFVAAKPAVRTSQAELSQTLASVALRRVETQLASCLAPWGLVKGRGEEREGLSGLVAEHAALAEGPGVLLELVGATVHPGRGHTIAVRQGGEVQVRHTTAVGRGGCAGEGRDQIRRKSPADES